MHEHDCRHGEDQLLPPGLRPGPPTRRRFLQGLGLAAGAVLLPGLRARPAAAQTLSGLAPVRTALHVHGSWSEGSASWEWQFDQAARAGLDVVWMTDHDNRALALGKATSLEGLTFVPSGSGASLQSLAQASAGSAHLLVEAADPAGAACALTLPVLPDARARLRTGVAGHVLGLTLGASRLDPGCRFELVVDLSHHPARAGRPAGLYRLVYRFGDVPPGSWSEGDGLTGVVAASPPEPGTLLPLDLVQDLSALWPDLFALDNGITLLTLRAGSPGPGLVADVLVESLALTRTGHDAPSVVAQQEQLVAAYAEQFPALTVHRSLELSGPFGSAVHWNPYGVPQEFPPRTDPDGAAAGFRALAARLEAAGGLASWNHPFGADHPVLELTHRAQVRARRRRARQLLANGMYGARLLEVAYASRAAIGIDQHLALLDTLWRGGLYVTGTGVNDVHEALPWPELLNGFCTGLWAPTAAEADLVAALRAGRAYSAHVGLWPGGWVDTVLDDEVPMGAVSVSGQGERRLAVSVGALPDGAVVELVRGPLDGDVLEGEPRTTVVSRLTASDLGSPTGTAEVVLDNAAPSFVRVQVRRSDGTVIGVGNPTGLLLQEPAAGVPAARRAP